VKAFVLLACALCMALAFAVPASAQPEEAAVESGEPIQVGAPEAVAIPGWVLMAAAFFGGIALGGIMARVRG